MLQTLQHEQGAFADVTSISDVERLARMTGPATCNGMQKKRIAAVQQQVQAIQQRQAAEEGQKWNSYVQEQDVLFNEKAPDLADPTQKNKVGQAAVGMLKDLGFHRPGTGSSVARSAGTRLATTASSSSSATPSDIARRKPRPRKPPSRPFRTSNGPAPRVRRMRMPTNG